MVMLLDIRGKTSKAGVRCGGIEKQLQGVGAVIVGSKSLKVAETARVKVL